MVVELVRRGRRRPVGAAAAAGRGVVGHGAVVRGTGKAGQNGNLALLRKKGYNEM